MLKYKMNHEINLYSKISELITSARKSLVRNINYTMVYTVYSIPQTVSEELQGVENGIETIKNRALVKCSTN